MPCQRPITGFLPETAGAPDLAPARCKDRPRRCDRRARIVAGMCGHGKHPGFVPTHIAHAPPATRALRALKFAQTLKRKCRMSPSCTL